MKPRIIFCLTLILCGGSVSSRADETHVIASTNLPEDVANQINRAKTLLRDFERTKSFDRLKDAYMTIATLPDLGADKTVPKTVARQERAKLWFSLLAVMRQNIDTNNYGPNNRSFVNLSPHLPTNGGPAYPSGVDPKVIKDPEIRAEYEDAIHENEKKKERALFQTQPRNLNQIVNIEAERFVRAYYTTSQEDQSELENLLELAKLPPDQAQKLKALTIQQ